MLTQIGTTVFLTLVGQAAHEAKELFADRHAARKDMTIATQICNLAHSICASWSLAAVWNLQTLHFGFGTAILNKCVLNPRAFNGTVFLVGVGTATLMSLCEAVMNAAGCNTDSRAYKVVQTLNEKVLPRLATLANVVTMVTLLYLGAPVVGAVGLGLVFYSSSLLFDIFHRDSQRSLVFYVANRALDWTTRS